MFSYFINNTIFFVNYCSESSRWISRQRNTTSFNKTSKPTIYLDFLEEIQPRWRWDWIGYLQHYIIFSKLYKIFPHSIQFCFSFLSLIRFEWILRNWKGKNQMNYGFRLRIENLSKYIQNKKKKSQSICLDEIKAQKRIDGLDV